MTENRLTGTVIGFAGLGKMGVPMALRLLKAGAQVIGFDPVAEASERLTDAGGRAASEVSQLSEAGTVILMLPSSAVVHSVLFDDGLADALGPDSTVIDMSSSEPLRTRDIATALGKRRIRLVDAPVSGGVKGAVEGTLTIMVGGADDDVAAVYPLLTVMGKPRHVGPLGAGHALKALNNLMSASHLWVTSEAMLAGEAFGLDPAVMLEAVNGSSGRSGSTENKWPNFILPGTYDSGFRLRLMLKDMGIAVDLARELGWAAVLGEAAVGLWQQAAEALPADADHTEVAAWLRAHHEPPTTTSPTARTEISPMRLTARQAEVKDEFIKVRGTWGPAWESILRLDPEFLLTYLNYSAVPLRKRQLEPKVQEFIYIAVNAAATHLHEPGVRAHVKAALDLGATAEEIMEVLELTSTLGVHALNIGVPVLVGVLEEEGLRPKKAPLTELQEQYKQEFTENRGYWHPFWDDMLELDPEIFRAYTDFSSVPWKSGTLEPKVKEFIYTAFDVAATHLYVPGLREHLRNALKYGATVQELLEVMEIASVIGIHGALLGAPILAAELDARQTEGSTTDG